MRQRSSTREWISLLVLAFGGTLLIGTTALGAQQTGTLAGDVTVAATGQPLRGAQVALEGLNIGSLTNDRGRYVIVGVPVGTLTVTVSHVGYSRVSAEVTIQVGETTQQDFAVRSTAIDLDEIVVTGTGAPTQRRRLGQTINTVETQALEAAPVQNVTDLLQGRVPSMVGAGIGLEGGAALIRLRGTQSLSQRNSPVIYVDGVRIDDRVRSVGAMSTSRLNDIPVADIERIEVIKGAAAATLFGTEASSGVIQIFTKRGTVSAPSYDFGMTQRISSIDAENRMPRNYRWDPATQQILTNHPAPEWVKPAWQQEYNLAVRGGTPGLRYSLSGSVADLPGSAPNNEVQRYTLRTALDFQHTERFSSRLDVGVVRNELQSPHPTWGAFAEFMLANPAAVTPLRPYGEQDFTIQGALDFQNLEHTDNYTISGGLAYAWTDNIRSDLVVGVNDVDVQQVLFIERGAGTPGSPSPGQRIVTQDARTNWTLDFKTNAETRLTDNIRATTTIGGQSFWEMRVVSVAGVRDFPSRALRTLRGGSTVTNVDEFQEQVINAGILFQEQLGFRDRLFLTGGLRMDGNSAFGEDFGFEFYPKAGLSWVISEEDFWTFQGMRNVRLRASYGTSGLQPGAFDSQQTWQPARGIENNQAVLPLNLGNPDLRPERSRELEVGLEFTTLEDRLGFEVVFFDQKTTDALLPARASPSLGFQQPQLRNLGALESWGVELTSSWTVVENPVWGLALNGGFSYVQQEITDMGGVAPFRVQGRRRWSQIREGFAPGDVIAPVYDPNNPFRTTVPMDQVTNPGQIQPNFLKAADGTDSLVFIGHSTPPWNASFGADLTLPGNLTARALFTAAGDFVISRESELIRQSIGYNLFMAELHRALDPNMNVPLEEKRRLIEEYGNRHPNMFSAWMEDATYLRLQEISLLWRVPPRFTGRWGLGGTTVALNARNLWFHAPNYDGIVDPGAGEARQGEFLQNIDYMQGPSPRLFGINVRTSFR